MAALIRATTAHAGDATQAQHVFKIDDTGCTHSAGTKAGTGATSAYVEVDAPSGYKVTVTDSANVIKPEPGGNGNLYKFDAGTPHSVKVSYVDSKGGSKACTDVIDPVQVSTVDAGDDQKTPATASDAAAMRWLAQNATVGASGRAPDGTRYLVHLPSGLPAYPFPTKVTEGTTLQVVLVVPTNDQRVISLSLDTCADTVPFRTTFDTTTQAPSKQVGHGNEDFVAVPIGQYFTCGAGAAQYSLKAGTTTLATTKLTFRPKYTLAAIALLGWDTGRRTTYSATTRAGSSEPTVLEHKDHQGIEGYVGGVWMIGGVDYEDMHWWNYFANLFVAVDPTAPTKNAVVGLALTPTGGLAVSFGLTLHEGQVLDGISPGDRVDGALSAHDSWNEKGFGGFVGLSIDSRIYDAIIAKFSN